MSRFLGAQICTVRPFLRDPLGSLVPQGCSSLGVTAGPGSPPAAPRRRRYRRRNRDDVTWCGSFEVSMPGRHRAPLVSPAAQASRAGRAGGSPGTATMSSLKERAGVKGVSACRFAVVAGFAGHGGMTSRRASPDWCPLVRAGRRVQDRAEPGRRGGATGVLDAPGGEPILGCPGESRRLRGCAGYAVVVAPSASGAVGSPLAAVIPSCRPAWRAGSAWGGPGQSGRGSITSSSAPPRRGCRRWRGTHIVAAARPAGPAAGHAAG